MKVFIRTSYQKDRHVSAIHDLNIKCPHKSCEKLISETSLFSHLKNMLDKEKKTCNKSISVPNYDKHVESNIKIPNRTISCKISSCSILFSSNQAALYNGSSTHKNPVKYPHDNCNKMMNPSIKKHVLDVHEKKREACNVCDKSISFNNFSTHLKRKHFSNSN